MYRWKGFFSRKYFGTVDVLTCHRNQPGINTTPAKSLGGSKEVDIYTFPSISIYKNNSGENINNEQNDLKRAKESFTMVYFSVNIG